MTVVEESRPHVVSQKTQTLGMLLFLLSLAILFAATMLVYVLGRLLLGQEQPDLGYMRDALTHGSNYLLFVSTVVVLAASVTIHLATGAIARERRGPFLKWLFVTDALAVIFVVLQIPAMLAVLGFHEGNVPGDTSPSPDRFYGVVFFLILLHAAHVAGGILYLAMVTVKALRGGYDHENYRGVYHAGLYWHFLDVVWLVMFGTLLALG